MSGKKKNEGKFMSMLERKGVVRKVDSEGEVQKESDIKAVIDSPDIPVKQASKQPIPGMSSPAFPVEDLTGETTAVVTPSSDFSGSSTPAVETEIEKVPEESFAGSSDATRADSSPGALQPEALIQDYTVHDVITEEPAPLSQEPSRVASVLGGLNPFKTAPEPIAVEHETLPPQEQETATRPDNYTDRYLDINDLYEALSLRSKKQDTIYLIEDYLQTLPDSLPDSARREIVGKLLAASGFDYDLLMGDGVLRVKMLREYAERFARHTDDYIVARQSEIDELNQQILRNQTLIENRKDLHKKQFYTIEAEAQRLKEILTFISG